MSVLAHVEIEPFFLVKILGRTMSSRRMKGNQMSTAVAFAQACSHCPDDFSVLILFNGSVSAENPNDIGKILIPFAENFTINCRILGSKYLRTNSPFLVPLISPGGQQADKQAFFFRLANYPIHMTKIGFVDPGGIVVDQRLFAFGIGRVQSVMFGQNNRLNDGKSFFSPIFQIDFGFRFIQPVKKFPCRVAQIKKRRAVFKYQKTSVVGYHRFAMRKIDRFPLPFHLLSLNRANQKAG